MVEGATNDTGLDFGVHGDWYTRCDDDCRNDAHSDQCKLPLNSERNDVSRKKQRNASDGSQEFLGNALIDAIAI